MHIMAGYIGLYSKISVPLAILNEGTDTLHQLFLHNKYKNYDTFKILAQLRQQYEAESIAKIAEKSQNNLLSHSLDIPLEAALPARKVPRNRDTLATYNDDLFAWMEKPVYAHYWRYTLEHLVAHANQYLCFFSTGDIQKLLRGRRADQNNQGDTVVA